MKKLSAVSSQPSGKSYDTGSTMTANRVSNAALYVNRGLGTFGFPVRLGVPPEITLLTLKRA
jgi:predicted MPP superfamily phosphohydrolase